MKKHILLFVSIFGLTACATWQQSVDWHGQDFDKYVSSHGVPTLQYTSPNGNIIYSFLKNCEHDFTKKEETLVTVGADNLIQSISTPSRCPNYYETPQYQYQQEMARRKKNDRERIEFLEQALQGNEIMISSQQTAIKCTETDLAMARKGINWKGQLSVTEYEKKLETEQNKLEQLKRNKTNYENEIKQLRATLYR